MKKLYIFLCVYVATVFFDVMFLILIDGFLFLRYGLYHTFNFVTGYKAENPTVKAIEWRLIVLESIAGVPGFVAAGNSMVVFVCILHPGH